MEQINAVLGEISGFVWGPVMLVLLFFTGIYLTIGLRLISLRWIPKAFSLLWSGRRSNEKGDITPFQSLMTALSSTVGTGNIAGVAGAIAIGGPGAVFWMWITALIGMATKYSESLLGVHFRETKSDGRHVGGPMYYIKNGLGQKWTWLAMCFAFFGAITALGIGNTIQASSVVDAMIDTFDLGAQDDISTRLIIGLALGALVAAVILGGIQRIGAVAAKLVPIMALFYVGGACIILLANLSAVPAAFTLIITDAFTGTAATGGFIGASIMLAIQKGVARGVFSNESGLGSAPIAHAAAQTKNPVEQGTIAMLGTFIDTIIICTMTALVIIVTGEWTTGKDGAVLSANAFETGLAGGSYIVTIGLSVFAFTTLIGWSYYGERCCEFLLGERSILAYRIVWVIMVPLGATVGLKTIWLIAEILNGLMAFPNLIALILLSPIVFKLTKSYRPSEHAGD